MITLDAETLDAMVASGEWHEADTAMATLRCNRALLFELIAAGRLNSAVVDGRAVISASSASAYAWARLEDIREEHAVVQARISATVTDYLDRYPPTGDLEDHLNHARPLLTSRRGKPSSHKRFGPEFHSVVINCDDLHQFALTQGEVNHDPVPSVGRFFDQATEVPGITATTWATPLFGDGKAVRLRRGLRINLAERPVKLSEELLAYVSTPPGERFAFAADDGPVDRYEADRGMYGDAYVDAKIASGEWEA